MQASDDAFILRSNESTGGAQVEVLQMVTLHMPLRSRFPGRFDSAIDALERQCAASKMSPLEAAARLCAEDWILMRRSAAPEETKRRPGQWLLACASRLAMCRGVSARPNRWLSSTPRSAGTPRTFTSRLSASCRRSLRRIPHGESIGTSSLLDRSRRTQTATSTTSRSANGVRASTLDGQPVWWPHCLH